MNENQDHIPAVSEADLVQVGVSFRPGSDPLSRGYDSLERYRSVPNHAMFLYTREDRVLSDYLREHWAALDGMSGDYCDILVPLGQLAGEEDIWDQLCELRTILGLESVMPDDLPALHVWSEIAACRVPLARCLTEAHLRDTLRAVFSVIIRAKGPITADHFAALRQDARMWPSDSSSGARPDYSQSIQGSTIEGDVHMHIYTH